MIRVFLRAYFDMQSDEARFDSAQSSLWDDLGLLSYDVRTTLGMHTRVKEVCPCQGNRKPCDVKHFATANPTQSANKHPFVLSREPTPTPQNTGVFTAPSSSLISYFSCLLQYLYTCGPFLRQEKLPRKKVQAPSLLYE